MERKNAPRRFASDIDALHEVYSKYRGSGTLDRAQLAAALEHLHLSPKRIDEIFARADADHDGQISFSEFVDFVRRHEAFLRKAFNRMDFDGSGFIKRDEVGRHASSV